MADVGRFQLGHHGDLIADTNVLKATKTDAPCGAIGERLSVEFENCDHYLRKSSKFYKG